MFTEDLDKARTPTGKLQKPDTYINTLLKGEIGPYSKKILIQKYKLDDATIKLQEVSARSVLSKNYGNAKIAMHELQAVMRRGTTANRYQDILNATIRREKEPASATRVQTQFRSHLARQEFERQKLIGVPAVAMPDLYQLYPSNVFAPTGPFVQADFDAFFGL